MNEWEKRTPTVNRRTRETQGLKQEEASRELSSTSMYRGNRMQCQGLRRVSETEDIVRSAVRKEVGMSVQF